MDIIITAGGSGIGRCLATQFASLGHRVFTCDINSDSLKDLGHENILSIPCDVSHPEEVDLFFDMIQSHTKTADVLINNAGVSGPTAPLEEMSVADWDRTIEININGFFYVSRRAIPMMKAHKDGSIINISSNAAFFGFPLRSPYTASKWALIGLTKTMAMELGAYNIRVNAICPGSVEGDRIERVIARDASSRGVSIEDVRREYTAQSSLGRFVTAQEIFDLCQFLASPSARNISGQAIGLDGHTEGLSLQLGNK
jgi:NAD(P)-dependent dehydrogenase (short-subunit alcohol dehydrogenase family)